MNFHYPAQRQASAQSKQREWDNQSETPNKNAMHQATFRTAGETSRNPATKGQCDDGKEAPGHGRSHTKSCDRIGVRHGPENRQAGTNAQSGQKQMNSDRGNRASQNGSPT